MAISTKNGKIKRIFEERKHKLNTEKLTYKKVAEKMNETLEKAGFPRMITEQQVKYLINEETELSILSGVALASALGCSLIDLLPNEVAELANLETRLILDSPRDTEDYFSEYEKQGRILIFSHFPSYIYLDPLEHFQPNTTPENLAAHKKRIKQLKSFRSFTTEYYEIKALLNFIFSPFYTKFNRKDKLLILDNYLKMFSYNGKKNLLYFFDANMHYRLFPSYELSQSKHTVIINTPLGTDYFLQIQNNMFFDKISQFIELNKNLKMLQSNESISLIEQLKQLLLRHEYLDCQAIIDFYHKSPPKLQTLLYESVSHLL